MSYDIATGTVNNSTTDPLVKYKALVRVDDVRPHMVGIIHNDVLKQSHVLTLRDVVLDSDPVQLAAFMIAYLRANKSVQLVIIEASIPAMLAAMNNGGIDFGDNLSFEFVARVGPINTVRYTNLPAILNLLNNAAPDSQQLTFTLK